MLLRHATLLHLDPPRVEDADVRVAGSHIAEVGPELIARPGELVTDLSGHLLMPGLVNAHTHLYSALACGMPLPAHPPPSFTAMLQQVWWRMDEALDTEAIAACARVGGLQALRAGVTTVIDHHASPNAILGSLELLDAGLAEVGVRRVLAYEVTDRGGPERARQGLDAHRALLRAGAADQTRAVLIGGHANFTLSDDTLAAMARLARDHQVGLHLHLAEATDDQATTGEPLVERLARADALIPGSIYAHGVHLRPEDLARIADAGAWLTHQPRSNMNNAVGYAPAAHFGPQVALGTDGIGSDLWAETQAAYFRAQEAGAGWTPARALGHLAAGARLAGSTLGLTLGKIERGAAADLVVLRRPPGPPLSDANLAAAFIFLFHAGAVQHVLVGGRWRLWAGAPTDVDERALDAVASAAARALWARMSPR